eukprot:TCONS_00018634-protein
MDRQQASYATKPQGKNTIFARIKRKEEHDKIAKLLKPYCRLLVRWPMLIVLPILLFVALSIVFSIIPGLGAKDYPNFSEPNKGFRPRVTEQAMKSIALDNLQNKKWGDYQLTNSPGVSVPFGTGRKRKRRNAEKIIDFEENLSFHCYIVYQGSGNLLTAQNMNDLCRLHNQYIKGYPNYNSYFKPQTHFLPSYIATLNNHENCTNLQDYEVNEFKRILERCVGYYKNGTLKQCIDDSTTCIYISNFCTQHSNLTNPSSLVQLIYNTFYYLTDSDFADDLNNLQYTATVDIKVGNLSDPDTGFFKPLYDDYLYEPSSLKVGDVEVVSYTMWNLKAILFEQAVFPQTFFIVGAILLILLLIWFYSGSIFIGVMTFICALMAIIISYFIYGRIYDLDFFPFLNVITLIFLCGITADDAFVYIGAWDEAQKIYLFSEYKNREECLIKWATHAIRHALISMLVTSLTTAAAFYANLSSVITSVKCFGLFAGTSIIVNYLLIITLFPAIVIIQEKYLNCGGTSPSSKKKEDKELHKFHKMLLKYSDKLFNDLLPKLILKGRFAFIIVFLGLGLVGCFTTFMNIQTPSSSDFQYFISSHVSESFELEYKDKFDAGTSGASFQNVVFAFGIKPADNGYTLDPDDMGTIELYDEPLDLPNVQVWLNQFCRNLRTASFIQESESCDNLEQFFNALTSRCLPGQSVCCDLELPLPNEDFMTCFNANIQRGQQSTEFDVTSPIFDSDGNLKTMLIFARTNFASTNVFDYNEDATEQISDWFEEQYSNVTSPDFPGYQYLINSAFDLQQGLIQSTKESLGVAIGVAFIAILFTTYNILLSLYSILTITLIISSTVGILVLSGWKLNVLESIVFSVSAGLSADFTLHYSVAYQTSMNKWKRKERVRDALKHIGPAILMGAVTTFIAGMVMTPSYVLAYLQMAQFLMLVTFMSWLFSTFFFVPLCAAIGPIGNLGQLTPGKIERARTTIRKSVSHRHQSIRQRISGNRSTFKGNFDKENQQGDSNDFSEVSVIKNGNVTANDNNNNENKIGKTVDAMTEENF